MQWNLLYINKKSKRTAKLFSPNKKTKIFKRKMLMDDDDVI